MNLIISSEARDALRDLILHGHFPAHPLLVAINAINLLNGLSEKEENEK